MKQKCLKQPSINERFGWKHQSAIEDETGLTSTFIDLEGQMHTIWSKYLIGGDGGGSRVRKTAGIRTIGGYLYVTLYPSLTNVLMMLKAICDVPGAF
jgi:2-polyprenyl-6-methoxyphenol hydroxylase-like FAD-dependent oxidoreductase